MDKLIAKFTIQLEEALQIASLQNHSYHKAKISNIVICGLGGSGIGGTIIANLLSNNSPIPLTVHKDYGVPEFVNENTLAIIYSYSGNTEETLDAFQKIIDKNAMVYTVSSGGKLEEWSITNNIPHILISAGMPPRSCLAYAIVQVLNILNNNSIINNSFIKEIEKTITLLNEHENLIKAEALKYASSIVYKLPIIYSASNIEGVTVRFRQQLNENSKILCWHNVLPEMNHNELVGWAQKEENKAVILLRNSYENERTKIRFEFVKSVIAKYCDCIIEINALGNSILEQSLYLVHLGDWISYYIANIRQIDPIEVNVIDNLKAVLEQK